MPARFKQLILIALIVLLTLSLGSVAEAQNSVLTPHKIVSLVYDDSGSMFLNAYGTMTRAQVANYAMQSFVSLMNTGDTLMITTMSNPTVSVPYVLTADRNALLDQLRAGDSSASTTPFMAVETAMNALKAQSGTASDEYWLVVITDGGFDMNTFGPSPSQALQAFSETPMPDGQTPKVVFMGIGNSAEQLSDAPGVMIYPKIQGNAGYSINGQEIVNTLNDIADQINGRTKLTDVQKVSDTVYRFTTKHDVFSLGILTQHTTSTLLSVKAVNGDSLNIAESYPLRIANSELYGADAQMFTGYAYRITANAGSIPANIYELTFDGPIDPALLTIMEEGGVRLGFQFSQNGTVLADLTKACVEDPLTVTCIGLDGSTPVVLSELLPADITQYQMVYSVNGEVRSTTLKPDMTIDLTMEEGLASFDAQATVTGYEPLTASTSFTPRQRYSASAQTRNQSEVNRIAMGWNAENAAEALVRKSEPDQACSAVVFTPLMIDEPMTAEQIAQSGMSCTLSGDLTGRISLAVQVNAEGQLVAAPYTQGFSLISPRLWDWLNCWWLPDGPLTVTLYCRGRALATGVVQVVMEPLWMTLLSYGGPILLLLLLLGYLFKLRFPRGASVAMVHAQETKDSIISDHAFWEVYPLRGSRIRALIPYMGSRFVLGGVVMQPGRRNFIQVFTRTLGSGAYFVHLQPGQVKPGMPFHHTFSADSIQHVTYNEERARQTTLLFPNYALVCPAGDGTAIVFLYLPKEKDEFSYSVHSGRYSQQP